MTSPCESLPAEVFDIIAAYLDLPGYQSVRLTSQRLHFLSLSTFTKRYFTKVITTLGSPSLDRLVHVANHSHLARLVTTLEIRLLNHGNYKDLTQIARVGIFPPPKRFLKVSCVRSEDIVQESTLYDNVHANRQSKCITERLTRGLRGLTNLTTIRIRAHDTEPLDWTTTAVPEGDQVFRSRCLRAVLDAIHHSGTSLSSFTMGKEKAHSLTKCLNAPSAALQLPPAALHRLRPAFAPLTHMTLSLVCAHDGPNRPPGWENGPVRFLASAPGLTSLALSLDRKALVSAHGARVLRSLSDQVPFEHLASLHVCNAAAHEADISKLTKTHAQTLRILHLANVCLLTGSWLTFLAVVQRAEGLQVLRLSCVAGVNGPVLFRLRDKARRRITLDAARSGRGMSVMVDEVVKGCDAGESVTAVYALSDTS